MGECACHGAEGGCLEIDDMELRVLGPSYLHITHYAILEYRCWRRCPDDGIERGQNRIKLSQSGQR